MSFQLRNEPFLRSWSLKIRVGFPTSAVNFDSIRCDTVVEITFLVGWGVGGGNGKKNKNFAET